jgi:hypothetical protein
MGLGWLLVADFYKRVSPKKKIKPTEISEYFRMR